MNYSTENQMEQAKQSTAKRLDTYKNETSPRAPFDIFVIYLIS